MNKSKNMSSDMLNLLRETRDYLQQWLCNLKQVNEVVPNVQQNLELIDWQITVLENHPDEAAEILYPGLVDDTNRNITYLREAFPMIPDMAHLQTSDTTAYTTSGSVFV
jgi:hypothetical protein